MGRRTSMRFVKNPPDNFYFKEGLEDPSIDKYLTLTIAEFEAMRLKHYMRFPQKDASSKMGVSQPTFSRILESAHQKVTQALIEGKNIRVYGGNIQYKERFIGYGCLKCNNEWSDESASKTKKVNCPKCESDKVYFLVKEPI